MKLKAQGLGELEAMVEALEGIHRHRQGNLTTFEVVKERS